MGGGSTAADDHDGRGMDREVVRHQLHPLGSDQAVEAGRHGVSQAQGHAEQARPRKTTGIYRSFMKVCLITSAMMKQSCFADAVHPTHEVRPAGCWAPKDQKVVLEQTSGRQRLNIHGAIDLETGKTRMIEVTTVDAQSTIALLIAIAFMYPSKRLIHVFLDNAKYHHAQIVQEWLARPGCRIKVHYI